MAPGRGERRGRLPERRGETRSVEGPAPRGPAIGYGEAGMSSTANGGSADGDRTGGERELSLTTVGCVRGQGGELGMVAAEFRYRPRDCLAVTLVLGAADDARVTWTFAWELLRQGLAGPAGQGDVCVRPVDDAVPLVEVALPSGTDVRLLFPAQDIASFVHCARQSAAADAHRIGPALDAELACIMEKA